MDSLPLPPPLDSSMDGADLSIQQSFKLVPWISWDEWSFVNRSLFSSSSSQVSVALRRVATWRSRGCIPVAVDVTASIIEIRQKDPFFRNDNDDGNSEQSEEMLSMLYSMAIMRLVNGVVEKSRKKNETSIAEAADGIDLPRMLIDVRHEGSHRELPSLPLLRLASSKALDWLKSYYWQPQESAFFVGSDVTTNLRKEITQKLLELASRLNVNRSTGSSSPVKRKHSKKDIAKAVKNVLRLYSSDSSEVATIVIEMLLKVSESSDLAKVGHTSEREGNDVPYGHDWNTIILKLSRKEPELLPTLLRAVLNKYEIRKNGEYISSQNIDQSRQIDQLGRLFEWLLDILKHVQHKMSVGKPESSFNLPNATLFEFLRKCVMASSLGDNQFMSSALVLVKMMGDSVLANKLLKLSLLSSKTEADIEVLSSDTDPGSFFSSQEDSIHQATEKFELIKSSCQRNGNVKLRESHVEPKRRWKVVDSWKQCPIGMLPHTIGASGRLPVLDLNDEKEETETPNENDRDEPDQSRGKREPEHDVASIDESSLKRSRVISESDREDHTTLEGLTGHLLIDGLWKKVSEDEVNAISSAVVSWELPLNLHRRVSSPLQAPLQCCSAKG